MPRSYVIRKLAKQNETTEESFIIGLLSEHKTPEKVAAQLGVYANSIRNWLKRNGYSYEDGKGWQKREGGQS